MISLNDINKNIVNQLRGALTGTPYENVPIPASDLSEIERPSLKVTLDVGKLENINANFKGRALTIRIYFFATDLKRYKIDNLNVQEIIEDSFIKGIWINDFFISINDINSQVVDTVLQVDFDLAINSYDIDEATTGEGTEFMEDLDFDDNYN